MSEFIFKKPTKNIRDFKIPLVLEIHSSLWTEDFRNYEVRDLLPLGRIYESPEILDAEIKIIDKISKGYYIVSPFQHKVFEKDQCLSGYMYLVDSPDGMEIYYHKKVKVKKEG